MPVPIGNYEDITLRALSVLKAADRIVCEEYKEAVRLLAHYEIKKELLSINEHNEREETPHLITLLREGKNIALISDCGTPLFSDPGHHLLSQALAAGIQITALPGASSLMPALSASGLHAEKFYYFGWLSPKKEIRKNELLRLKKIREVIVLLDTPYRLQSLLRDCSEVFGGEISGVLAYEISKQGERYIRMPLKEMTASAQRDALKGEFVLLIDNRRIQREEYEISKGR
ncbi:MAG: Ribosomal RNA small subunit methyltransferase I [Ignavibacteriaceae bacterium]|nr:Ribosomal RNA small subunit methyltransferase I [Ignavibacteriaceae bacterium]